MNNKISLSRLVTFGLILVLALFAVLTLTFSAVYIDIDGYNLVDPDNGFVWMGFDTNFLDLTLEKAVYDILKPVLGIISIAQLIFGIAAIGMTVAAFLNPQRENLLRKVKNGTLASMIVYAVEGIVVRALVVERAGGDSDYVKTAAFIPLIIGIVLLVAIHFVPKFLPDTSIARNFVKPAADTATATAATTTNNQPAPQADASLANEETSMNLLKNYKDMLDAGVITQEEYDAKKKQLLNL